MRVPNDPDLNPGKTAALKKTRFTKMMILENGLDQDGFEGWVFCPGMRFNAPDKWWGDHGPRDFPHEGVDLCLYQNRSRQTRRLDQKTRIPVMHDGVVRAIFTDFLGQAVVIEHDFFPGSEERLLSVYAHTTPLKGIEIGLRLKAGDIIATLAATGRAKSKIIPHLHLSLGLPSPALSYVPFFWNIMRNPDLVTLLDPLAVIDGPCHELDIGSPPCLFFSKPFP